MFIPVRSLSEGIYCTAVSAAYDWICVTHVFNITIMRAESPEFQSSAVYRTDATRINQAENDDFVISNKKQTNKYRRAISDFLCVCCSQNVGAKTKCLSCYVPSQDYFQL